MLRFLAHFGAAAVLTLAAVAGFNMAVDPFRIFRADPSAPPPVGLFHYNQRDIKPLSLIRLQPDVLILGTSRAELALRPDHPGFGRASAVNLATLAQPYAESLATLRAAVKAGGVRQVVMGLDFELANAWLRLPSGAANIDPDWLDRARQRLSLAAAQASVVDVLGWDDGSHRAWHVRGQRLWDAHDVHALGGNRRMFEVSEDRYLRDFFFPRPHCRFDFEATARLTPLDDVRALIALAHRERIDLRLFISPAHARQWETLAQAGLWDRWEDWKARVVRINEEEAARRGAAPFALWDFSGYDALSSEALPADAEHVMRYFYDAAHITPAFGDLVLDRVLGVSGGAREAPEPGVRLQSATLDEHLRQLRVQRQVWQAAQPEVVAQLQRKAHDSAARRSCTPLADKH